MTTAKADVKTGLFLGIGLVLAFMILGFLQLLVLRAVNRGRSTVSN